MGPETFYYGERKINTVIFPPGCGFFTEETYLCDTGSNFYTR